MKRIKHIYLFFTFLLFFSFANAQVAPSGNSPVNQSVLSIEQIMEGEKFVGYLPEDIRWGEEGQHIYFSWNPDGDTLRSTWKVALDSSGNTSEPQRVADAELMAMSELGDYSADRNLKVYEKFGDLFLIDFSENETRQLTNTLEPETNPRFSGDGKVVVFQRENNLFSWEMETGFLEQLTDFQKGYKKNASPKLKLEKWLENDQLNQFEVLAERKSIAEAQKKRAEKLKPKRPKTYHFGQKKLGNLSVSPDLRFVTFRLLREGEGERTEVPNYVTESGKVEPLRSRPKVGAPVSATEMGLYDREQDTIFMLDISGIEGLKDKPVYLKEYLKEGEEWKPEWTVPREVVWHGSVFSEGGKAVVMAKAQDNKDRWIFLLDLPTGNLKLLHREHDDAWVGGPGISNWNFAMGTLGWMDEEHIFFQSEETGFSHLYALNVESGKKQALTEGDFEIWGVELSQDKSTFYLTANKETPFERHFYHLSTGGIGLPKKGGAMEKITSLPGRHQVEISPDEKWLAIRRSFSNQPWELYLMPNEVGGEMRQLTHSTTEAFEKYDWRAPEIIHFTARDGVKVPARLYRPQAGNRNGAAVVFVHGAGYLQNVHRWWSSYYREYMFHHILTDNGYTVLDIDYRGSQGYGRDWRTAIYRHMGGKDLSDQVDGAKYLVEKHGIDSGRIGIYGGSYGGFITLMAQFTSPGTFKSGAALRSVTDWAHYNHGYTSNILNTPVEDSIAFRRSSPIYFAEGLQGHLLILHGVIDTNVQFQDVVRLAQRLVELGKDDWEFAVFPLEGHGFREASSWTDEYKRIFKLFDETLRE